MRTINQAIRPTPRLRSPKIAAIGPVSLIGCLLVAPPSRSQSLPSYLPVAITAALDRGQPGDPEPSPNRPPSQPKHCKAEGKRSNDPGRCCSNAAADGVCCGAFSGSCAQSGCCEPGTHCYEGVCVACLPEGAEGEADDCCSRAASKGICCGETFCEISGCCADALTPYCHDGLCLPCLFEGTPGDEDSCCSQTTSDGICCGDVSTGCAASGCCAPGEAPFCRQGTCLRCVPEGEAGDESSCCSESAMNGICCAGSDDHLCEVSGCCADPLAPYCHDGLCLPCLPEGAFGDEESCCSQATSGGICCGEAGGSCATGLCCAAGATCEDGECRTCLEDGSPTDDPTKCCSSVADSGVCCGEPGGSCAVSGCCAEGVCADGACIDCIPEGEAADNADLCCSETTAGGVCCGEENGSCVSSGCCSAGQTCHLFLCSDCQPVGGDCTQSDCCEGDCCDGVCIPTDFDPENCGGCGNTCTEGCCDGACIQPCGPGALLDPDTCMCVEACQEPGSPCGDNGTLDGVCCGEADCCDGTCRAPCPDGQSRDPLNCQCLDVCAGGDGTLDPACATDEGFLIRVCCDGICCPLGDFCLNGVCMGGYCAGAEIGLPVQYCPSGTACICRTPNSNAPNPEGCFCCPKCPAGAGQLSAFTDCKGHCGTCCSSCVDPQFDGSYECGG